MKQAAITKSLEEPTSAELEQISRFARRPLKPEEVYLFSLVLCDNDVDRDLECFPRASLEKLAELFVGKTGIFDHNPKGENQTARIYKTQVLETPGRTAASGERYACLKAWAYMVRCPKNEDLILEIDAGIKKEVSVGCAVGRVRCSVCGKDLRQESCPHRPGQAYGPKKEVCYHLLEEPTDAYEWSFVAVPAQPQAGVTKSLPAGGTEVEKALGAPGERITLSRAQCDGLLQELARLKGLAAQGERYREELKKQAVSLAACALPGLSPKLVAKAADACTLEELTALRDSLREEKNRRFAGRPQLEAPSPGSEEDNGPFCI